MTDNLLDIDWEKECESFAKLVFLFLDGQIGGDILWGWLIDNGFVDENGGFVDGGY